MKISKYFFMALVALLITLEIALRSAGVLDIPLFSAGPPYGYIPRPNQSGAFLHKNDWAFNERSMGTARRFETTRTVVDTLLIGDSIVSGGNPYKQSDRLGPQIENRIGGRVWPISANSWSFENELTYVRINPAVSTNVDRFVFIINSEDFREASIWRSSITHPTRKPVSALAYVIQKKFVRPRPQARKPFDPKPPWSDFKSRYKQPIFVVAYPSEAESKDSSLRKFNLVHPLLTVVGQDAKLIDAGADPRWKNVHYRDNIHPDPNGTRILAEIISDNMK